jgi:hypothetical protein
MLIKATVPWKPAPIATPDDKNLGSGESSDKHVCVTKPSNHSKEMKVLPESTGWTLFSKIEKASRVERFETDSAISSLLVNMYEICFPKAKWRAKNITPIPIDILRTTLMANFAALEFPLPSSFDTRTLYKLHNQNSRRSDDLTKRELEDKRWFNKEKLMVIYGDKSLTMQHLRIRGIS